MPVGTQATGSAHSRGPRLHMWRGNGSVAIDSLALPGGNAP
jgi:hypothetical protein